MSEKRNIFEALQTNGGILVSELSEFELEVVRQLNASGEYLHLYGTMPEVDQIIEDYAPFSFTFEDAGLVEIKTDAPSGDSGHATQLHGTELKIEWRP